MHYVAGRPGLEVGAVVLLPLREKVAGEAGRMRGTKTRDGWLKALLTGKTGSHPHPPLRGTFSRKGRRDVDRRSLGIARRNRCDAGRSDDADADADNDRAALHPRRPGHRQGPAACRGPSGRRCCWAGSSGTSTGSWVVAVAAIFGLFVHEYGHVLAMNRLGMGPAKIYIIPFLGGLARGQRNPDSEWHGVLVSLAGPAFGLLAACPPSACGWSPATRPGWWAPSSSP